MLIQKLRLQRGWSQQHLAEISGLSARTIQRIEAGHPASLESLKSLAAVFEVDLNELNPESTMEALTDNTLARQEAEAFRYVRRLKRFYMSLITYVAMMVFLTIINLVSSPKHLWVGWVALFWGLGLVLSAARLFLPDRLLGGDWEKREVERRLGRPL